ncbi:MAG: DUF3857 domain-containing protein [Bacteroidota bacterium]
MKIQKLLVLSLLVGMSYGWAQDFAFDEIPSELAEDVQAVVRYDRTTIEVENASRAVWKQQYAVTILEEDAVSYGFINIPYDKNFSKVRNIEAAIYDKNGKRVSKIKSNDFEDFQPSDYTSLASSIRLITARTGYSKYPYTVVYSYEKTIKGIHGFPTFYVYPGANVSVEEAQMVIKSPSDFVIRHKTVNTDIEARILQGDDQHIYSWEWKNMKPIESEYMSPGLSQVCPKLLVATNTVSLDDYEGSMASWQDYGAFFYDLNKERDELPPAMVSKVHELTDSLDDPFEKIDVLYRYMQDNTRYVSIQLGIGGFQTFEASYVFEKGYGDCKALSNYMKSMLKEIGIKSHHVIIGAGKDRPAVVTDFVSNQFNHMILCVPNEQDTVWLECTSNVNPTGYLGLFTENRHALVLTAEGGVLTSTPRSGPAENAQFRTAEVALDDAGNATVKTEIRGLGNAQGAFTEFAKNRTKEDQEEFLREYWIEASSFDLENYEFEVLPPSNPPEARLRYVLSARNWSSLSGSRLFLTPNVLENNLSLPPIVDDRTQPLCNYVPKLKHDTITYTLPEGYIVEAMDTDPTEINWKHGNYRSQIELVDPQTLRYTRSFMLERFNLPASEYNAYRKFIKAAIKADRQQIVLSSRS